MSGSGRTRAAHPATPTLAEAMAAAAERLAHHSESPRLDAEVLLLHILGRDRAFLRAWPERTLDTADAERFHDWIEKRAAGAPVAYLTGTREFWSRSFYVGPGVLIPRPETEVLVERALDFIPADSPVDILDLGTGSGIIAITLAAERPSARVTATDLSPDALAIARRNADRQGVQNLRFLEGDWFAAVPAGAHFDLVASNPPYIADADPHLGQGDLRSEPRLALASGADGLDALRAIAAGSCGHLQAGGMLLLEHGYDQADRLASHLAALGYTGVACHSDLQGHRRAISAIWPG